MVSVADDGGIVGPAARAAAHRARPATSASAWWPWPSRTPLLASAFEHRFDEGELAGHALGNLILAGLIEATGDLVPALDEAGRLLGVQGRVLPATTERVVLKAEVDRGHGGRPGGGDGDRRHPPVSLVPDDAAAPPLAVERHLERRTRSCIGPGSLFTSVLAAVAVPGIAEAVGRSQAARRVYVCNLRPQIPETAGFDVGMHVDALAGTRCRRRRGRLRHRRAWPRRSGRPGHRRIAGPSQRPGPRPGQTGAALSDLLA